MLTLFYTRPDSPLANDKERKRILAELAQMDAPQAIGEVADWLEALQGEAGFSPEDRFNILCQFDDAAALPIRSQTREYFSSPNLSRARSSDPWRRANALWQGLSAGYVLCFDLAQHGSNGRDLARRNLPALCLRLLHAHRQWFKWRQFHYGPLDPSLWQNTGAVYLAALQQGLAASALPLPGGSGQGSAQREYLRLLALHASAVDHLRPQQIEIASNLIGHLVDGFDLSAQNDGRAIWWIDPARPMPPMRIAREPVSSPSLRYLCAANARSALQDLIAAAEREIIPPEVDLGAQYPAKVVLPVMRHLALYWSASPPQRAHARHAIRSSLRTVSGREKVSERVSGRAGAATDSQIEDVSRGGFSISARAADEEQLRLGALIGLQPDGGDNWLVGIVRRAARQADGSLRLGIETLSHTPAAVQVQLGGERIPAVLLDTLEAGAKVRLVLPQYGYEDRAVVTLEQGDLFAELEPAGLVETVDDGDIARYRVARLCSCR